MLWNTTLIQWLVLIPVLLISLTIHELSHGFAAYMLGDNTAKRMGRLTLNPLKHIDPLGFIMLVVAGFGWAKPVPVDPSYFKEPKRGMALTALAGPFSNILLAFASAVGLSLATNGNWLIMNSNNIAIVFIQQFFVYNCVIAMFNLLPVPPLDGSKVVAAFLPNRLYFKYMSIERYGMIILILLAGTGMFSGVLSNGVRNLMRLIFKAVSLIGL